MQLPPIPVNELTLVFVLSAIILLITAELASPRYGSNYLVINRKRLHNVSLLVGTVFLTVVTTRIVGVFLGF
jgi:hypothetical protein